MVRVCQTVACQTEAEFGAEFDRFVQFAAHDADADWKQLRLEKNLPALDALHDWLRTNRGPYRAATKAIDYSLKCWIAFSRYFRTGDLSIDDNPVDNGIRPLALGKRIGCLQAPNAPVGVPLSFKPCLAPSSSTASISEHG